MVQGLAFLSKKSWHTKNLANQEKVWVAEQRSEAEASKTKELARQIQQEREQEELDRISGKKTAMDRGIDWMYQGGTTGDLAREDAAKKAEEFLLGKEYVGPGGDKGDFESGGQKEGINNVLDSRKPAAVAAAGAADAPSLATPGEMALQQGEDDPTSVKHRNESFRLRVEDPMFMVKQKHYEKTAKAEKNRALYEKVVGPTSASHAAETESRTQSKEDARKERKREKKEKKREEKERRREEKERKRHHRSEGDDRPRKRRRSRSRSRSNEASRKSHRRDKSRSRSRSRSNSSGRYYDDKKERHSDRSGRHHQHHHHHHHHHHSRDEEEDWRRHSSKEYDSRHNRSHPRRGGSNDDTRLTKQRDHNNDNGGNRSDRRRGDHTNHRTQRNRRDSDDHPDRSRDHNLGSSYTMGNRADHGQQGNDQGSQGMAPAAKEGFGLQGGSKRGSINRDDLGPNQDLLRKKREEQDAERRRIREVAASRRRVSGEDRAKALEEMKSDARRRDEAMARKASERPDRQDDENALAGGQASFLQDMTRRTHGITDGGVSLSSRVAQNRHTNQRSHESFL